MSKRNYVKANAILSDIELFDANFFDFSPKEAELTDPQHRLFLECAWLALENAGYDPETYPGSIGVYAGVGMNTYLLNNLYPIDSGSSYQVMIGNDKDFLSTRVSYKLNLTGPSVNVQTACSTSLVAVHLACQSLINGECNMALVGGVSIRVPQKAGYLYQEGMIMSPDGHCRAFDANAKGTVGGNGVGIVVLKGLEEAIADGDNIIAIIRGSAINNDGAVKVGYTAPSVEGQAAVIKQAQGIAEIEPETITYVETHGTGTVMGDPMEIAALKEAFATKKKGFCAIGSLKTNMGHLDVAAGVAGLIKTVLALKHKLIPPSLNFEKPNPQIDFTNSPFYVNTKLAEWKTNGTPRRAGVSSFGIGGTNAHVVLEEWEGVTSPQPPFANRGRVALTSEERVGEEGINPPNELLLLSAKTPSALEKATENLAEHLKQHPELHLADVTYTLSIGRRAFNYRRMLVCSDIEDAVNALSNVEPTRVFSNYSEAKTRPVVFMFSGQGSQYVNMGRELYEMSETFRSSVDLCCELLQPHLGLDLRNILYPRKEVRSKDFSPYQITTSVGTASIQETAIAQPALFVIEYALAQLWISWGVRPAGAISHSIGEYVAATIAGVFSLEDALILVAARGKLMQQMATGSMLAVPLPEAQVQPQLGTSLEIAAINGPSSCVVSGPTADVEALQKQLAEKGTECRRLHTSHAFHSQMMSPILAPFTEQVKQVNLNSPEIPYISNVTGTWITVEQATDPNYWAKHLRQPVRFAEGLQQFLCHPEQILLEVGPGQTLRTLAKRHPNIADEQIVLTSVRHPQEKRSDVAFLLNTLGQLWLAGVPVDWSGFYTSTQRRRLPLPTYPFERQRYWIELAKPKERKFDQQLTREPNRTSAQYPVSNPQDNLSSQSQTPIAPRNQLEEAIAGIWGEVLGNKQVGIHDNFFDLGGDSMVAVQVISKLQETYPNYLEPHSILNAPTIAELANLIELSDSAPGSQGERSRLTSSCLVQIQSGSSKKQPLFLVHPVGGHVYFYRDLANCLGWEQPVYGLQALGLDGKSEPHTQVEEMAAHYIKAMRIVQPEGSYLLGGSSFGGTVAFEMAQQLHAIGEKVAVLAIIDTPGPGQMPAKLETETAIIAYLADFLLEADGDSLSLNYLQQLEAEQQLNYLVEQARKTGQLFSDIDLFQARQLVKIFKINMEAMWNYIPQVYPGRILFFRAQKRREKYDPLHPELPWIDIAAEGIEIYTIPGTHITMNSLPHVQVLAERMKVGIKNVLQ